MRSAVSSPRLCVYLFACTIISSVQSNWRTSATGQQLPEQLSTVRKRCLVGNSRDSSSLSSYAVMYVCMYTLCMSICIFIHMYTHELKYVCLCVFTFWEGKCPISQGKLSGCELSGGEISGGELSWGR